MEVGFVTLDELFDNDNHSVHIIKHTILVLGNNEDVVDCISYTICGRKIVSGWIYDVLGIQSVCSKCIKVLLKAKGEDWTKIYIKIFINNRGDEPEDWVNHPFRLEDQPEDQPNMVRGG